LVNLLANAATHTPLGTTITTALHTDAKLVAVTVHDDGPGIAPYMVPRIFDRFVRADSARANREGSGLGLSIVAAIVEAHAGTVRVESRHGSTTFTVDLPLAGRSKNVRPATTPT
jgi:signal transduction histidine kinase